MITDSNEEISSAFKEAFADTLNGSTPPDWMWALIKRNSSNSDN